MTKDNKNYKYPRHGEKLDTQGDYYNFVFSSNIEDWMVGYKLKWNRKYGAKQRA